MSRPGAPRVHLLTRTTCADEVTPEGLTVTRSRFTTCVADPLLSGRSIAFASPAALPVRVESFLTPRSWSHVGDHVIVSGVNPVCLHLNAQTCTRLWTCPSLVSCPTWGPTWCLGWSPENLALLFAVSDQEDCWFGLWDPQSDAAVVMSAAAAAAMGTGDDFAGIPSAEFISSGGTVYLCAENRSLLEWNYCTGQHRCLGTVRPVRNDPAFFHLGAHGESILYNLREGRRTVAPGQLARAVPKGLPEGHHAAWQPGTTPVYCEVGGFVQNTLSLIFHHGPTSSIHLTVDLDEEDAALCEHGHPFWSNDLGAFLVPLKELGVSGLMRIAFKDF